MKFNTNEERQESTARVIEGARNDIAEIKAELRSTYGTRKGLDIKYLDIFYNVTDEEFEILGIFTVYGRVFWVSKANTIILKTVFVDEFIGEVEEWIQCYVTKEKRSRNKYPVVEEREREEADFLQGATHEGYIANQVRAEGLRVEAPPPREHHYVANAAPEQQPEVQQMLRPGRIWQATLDRNEQAVRERADHHILNNFVAAPDINDHPMPPFR